MNERAICHIGNAYYLNAVELRNLRCKTNTVSNTAYRGFGGPQGMFVIENIIDDIARYLGCDPVEIRQRNFFAEQPGGGRDRMHYGAEVRDNVAPKLVAELLQVVITRSVDRLFMPLIRTMTSLSVVLR